MTLKRTSPLARGKGLKRGKTMKRGGKIKANKRTASEFARVYGSKARVRWIKGLPCVWCMAKPSVNAHTVTGGMGRKADAHTIVPLCASCHDAYDMRRGIFQDSHARDFIKSVAAKVDAIWQQRSSFGPSSLSSSAGAES